MSWQGEAEPSGTVRQTTNQDHEATVAVLEVDVVYPLPGDSAMEGEPTSGYLMGSPPINRPLERYLESDGGGISWKSPRAETTCVN